MSVYRCSQNVPENWRCSICYVEDPQKEGGVVEHGGEGEKHPIHRDCAIKWSESCPTCRKKTDISKITPFFLKLYEQAVSSKNFALMGFGFSIYAALLKKKRLAVFACLAQYVILNRALNLGRKRVLASQSIVQLAQNQRSNSYLIADIASQFPSHFRTGRVEQIIAQAKKDVIGDQGVDLWKKSAGIAALFFAAKLLHSTWRDHSTICSI